MNKSIVGIAAVAAVALSASLAHADNRTHTGHYGAWDTYAGTVTPTGGSPHPMCAAKLGVADRNFQVQYEGDQIYLHIYKSGWKIPDDTRIDVKMQIDQAPIYTMHSLGYTTNGEGYIEFTFDWDAVNKETGQTYLKEFTNLLRNGLNITFAFPGGSEPNWTGSLNGSNAAMTEFIKCSGEIYDANHQTHQTQPFTQSQK